MTGPIPHVAICRSAEDSAAPCRYAQICHETRQRLMHYEGLRGMACWAFQRMADRHVAPAQTQSAGT